jgi:hypothetical protein
VQWSRSVAMRTGSLRLCAYTACAVASAQHVSRLRGARDCRLRALAVAVRTMRDRDGRRSGAPGRSLGQRSVQDEPGQGRSGDRVFLPRSTAEACC